MNILSRAQSIRFSALIGITVVVVDQLTKWLVIERLPEGGVPVIPGFFGLVLAYNPGAAFGLFGQFPPAIRYTLLGVASCLAIGAILMLVIRSFAHSRLALTALGAICGGAVGNLIDRFRLGVVVDFLDVYWGEYHWPAFNVADSAICVGVMILLLLKPKTAPVEHPDSSNQSVV